MDQSQLTGAPVAMPDDMLKFVVQRAAASESGGRARWGQLTLPAKAVIHTPHYVVPTSRGAVPHMSPDTLQKHTNISAVYVALEDFIEKSSSTAPIFATPVPVPARDSRLRQYIGLPARCASILGPRRVPSIAPPAHNTNASIAISTSVGFRPLEASRYNDALATLAADVSLSLADVVTAENASGKRKEKSADRTHAWLRDGVERARRQGDTRTLFAAIPPLAAPQLAFYLADLQDEYRADVAGLCLHETATLDALPAPLRELPTLALTDLATPQQLLAAIHAGVDLITVPFVTQASEHGVALSFSFASTAVDESDHGDQPLGTDLWSREHATDLSGLGAGCACYACRRHHRAYVHHLLQANEMLAWTLLQIHNMATVDAFFDAVRRSLRDGTFDDHVRRFHRRYAPELPEPSGQGPRVRGYQIRSVGGGEPRRNPKAYGKLDEQMQKLAESASGVATPDGSATSIEEHGLAQRVEQLSP